MMMIKQVVIAITFATSFGVAFADSGNQTKAEKFVGEMHMMSMPKEQAAMARMKCRRQAIIHGIDSKQAKDCRTDNIGDNDAKKTSSKKFDLKGKIRTCNEKFKGNMAKVFACKKKVLNQSRLR